MAMTGISFFRPKATTEQKLGMLRVLLNSLPKPSPDDPGVAISAYLAALGGVSQAALEQSLAWALQGRHGSLFVPWPTELRKLCDEAEQPFLDELARLKRQEQIAADKLPPLPQPSPEEIARQQERMRRFYNMHDKAKADLLKQFPKPEPPEKLEPPPRIDVNPPDWLDGQKLHVTPVLLKALGQQDDEKMNGSAPC
jgi:hypothetical protein